MRVLLTFYAQIRKIKQQILLKKIKMQLQSIGQNPHFDFPLNLRGGKYISIGDNFIANARLRLDALNYLGLEPELKIGNNVNINFDCHIGCVNNVVIGNNVLIASKVFITDHTHGDTDFDTLKIPPRQRKIISKGPVVVNDNVWIGEGAVILPNVTIGENSVIGSNAVVTKSIPPFSVVAGVPAKIIRTYSDKL